MRSLTTSLQFGLSALLIAITGCAGPGSTTTGARPVLYPNAKLNTVGQDRANQDSDACMAQAAAAGLTPEEKNNSVMRGAEKGAGIGGVAAAVGTLVRGQSIERVVENGAAGAVVGGATGATAGAMSKKPSSTYRNFVQRCLKDKGYEVIGWN